MDIKMCFLLVAFCATFLSFSEAACREEPNGVFLPEPSSRNRFLYCWNGESIVGECPQGQEFDPFDRICFVFSGNQPPPSKDPCSNRADGTFLPDPSSRQRFLYCNSGESIPGYCDDGSEFNPQTLLCDPVFDEETGDMCFNEPDGTFLPDPSSRNGFYYCSNREAISGSCPEGQNFFDYDGGYCDYDETTTTTRRPPPPAPSTTRRPVPTTTRRPAPTTTRRPVPGPTTTSRRPVPTTTRRPGPAPTTTRRPGPVLPTTTKRPGQPTIRTTVRATRAPPQGK